MEFDGLTLRWRNVRPDLITAVAVILVGIASHAVASMKPVVIGAYIHQLAMAPDHAGYTLTVEMVASSIGTTVVAFLPRLMRQRSILLAALLLIIVGNLLSLWGYPHPLALLASRAICGLGEGIGLGRLAIAIASFRQPDRIAGLYSVSSAAVAAIGAFAVPRLHAFLGPTALFILLTIAVLPAFLALRAFPTGVPEAEGPGRAGQAGIAKRLALCGGLALYYVAIGSYWPFVGVVGTAAGFDYATTSSALAWAGMAMVVASCVAIVTGHGRHSAALMLVLLGVGLAGVAVPMVFPGWRAGYVASVCAFGFAWFALFPFLLGLMSRLDASGQLNGLLYVIAAAAFAAGPAVAAWLVGPSSSAVGIGRLQAMTLVTIAAASLVLGRVAWRHARSESS